MNVSGVDWLVLPHDSPIMSHDSPVMPLTTLGTPPISLHSAARALGFLPLVSVLIEFATWGAS